VRKRVSKNTKSVVTPAATVNQVSALVNAINSSSASASATPIPGVIVSEVVSVSRDEAADEENVAEAVTESAVKVKKTREQANRVSLLRMVRAAKGENKAVFNKVPTKTAVAIAQAVFEQFNQHRETSEGNVKLLGFGKFMVRQVRGKKKGENITRKRVFFRAVTPKEDGITTEATADSVVTENTKKNRKKVA
jgi:hypothetical protein